jgi:Zn finger protein HypA/HybF involved in hydrogenase expression
VIRALEPLKAGTELCITYVDPQLPTKMRQAELLESKFFECRCPRCTDPRDGYFAAFHCPLCTSHPLTLQRFFVAKYSKFIHC